MSTEQIYTLAASCLLIAAGIAAFPYRLNDANTSWLPRKLRPDRKYLERPYEYDYPARNVNLLFSVSVAVTGMLALIVMLTPELAENAPPEIWFSALAVLYPAYASCQVLFWRKDYGNGFCYADRLTAFRHGKVYAVLLTGALLFILHLIGYLPLPAYRVATVAFCLLCCTFLIHDYIRVFRLRGDHEYSDPIGWKEMYPESLNLMAFPLLSAAATASLWRNPAVCAILFGLLLLLYTAVRHVCRFHPSVRGDEHERRGWLLYRRRCTAIHDTAYQKQ